MNLLKEVNPVSKRRKMEEIEAAVKLPVNSATMNTCFTILECEKNVIKY